MEEPSALLTSVARMYYLDGLGQSEIASIYGISRSTVSRLLTAARERRIVRISVDEYDPRDRELEQQLVSRLGLKRALAVRVQDSNPDITRRTVAYFAAPIVSEWMYSQSSIGVSGGRTVAQLTNFIPAHHQETALNVVQLMGSIGSTPSSIESSELCRTLARRFQGSFHTINAPAFMDSQRNRDLLVSHAQIQAVFSLFPTLDMSVVGIGTLEESVFVERNALAQKDLDVLRRKGAVGEMCGRYFNAKGVECDTPLRDQVISVELDLLRTHRDVMCVTTGIRRREALLAAVRGGLIQSLVIDDTGARDLLSGA